MNTDAQKLNIWKSTQLKFDRFLQSSSMLCLQKLWENTANLLNKSLILSLRIQYTYISCPNI